MKRVKRFGVYQTAKVAAVIYFLISACILVPIGLLVFMFGNSSSIFPFGGGMILFVLPFIYGFIGFLFTALGCAIYNAVSKWTGGIEVEIETAPSMESYTTAPAIQGL
jgi:hypothetical protein